MIIDKKKMEVIGAVLIIVTLIIFVIFLLRKEPKGIIPDQDTAPVADTFDQSIFPTRADPNQEVEIVPDPIARVFVERFGSFSTESDYMNIDDVLVISTPDLKLQLELVARKAREESTGSFYGVSTKYLKMDTIEETENFVVVMVSTQREESFDSPKNTSIRYQDIELELIKENDAWLVSGFSWQ